MLINSQRTAKIYHLLFGMSEIITKKHTINNHTPRVDEQTQLPCRKKSPMADPAYPHIDKPGKKVRLNKYQRRFLPALDAGRWDC